MFVVRMKLNWFPWRCYLPWWQMTSEHWCLRLGNENRSVWRFRTPKMRTVPWLLSRYSDWLRAGRSGDRIPVGARIFAHVQIGPGAHPASCTMGTWSIPGVKRPERGADHTTSFNFRDLERVKLYLYSPSRPHRPVIGSTLPLLPWKWTLVFAVKILDNKCLSTDTHRICGISRNFETDIFNKKIQR
jgi:hypothetical protein